MITAASNSPGASGPSADAAAESESQAPQHLPDPSKVRKGAAALPKQIRPIPPKRDKVELPGVDTGFNSKSPFDAKIAKALGRDEESGEGMDLGDAPEFGAPKTKAKPAAQAAVDQLEGDAEKKMAREAKRGPDGKFLPATEGEGEQEADAGFTPEQEAAVLETDLPEAPEEEDTLEGWREKAQKAEQRWKSLQGQFTPLNVQIKELVSKHNAGARIAHGWKARADAAEAELAKLKAVGQTGAAVSGAESGGSSQPSAALTGTGLERAQEIAKRIDWQMYGHAKEQGDDTAALYLATQIANIVDADHKSKFDALRSEFEGFRKPFTDQSAHQARADQVIGVFDGLAAMETPDGGHAFPELWDEHSATAVGETWKALKQSLKLSDEAAATPMFAALAVASHRFYGGGQAAPAPSSTAELQEPEPEDDEEEEDETDLNARPARALVGSRAASPVRQPSSAERPRDPASAIKHAMRITSEVDNAFGFPTRKSALRR